MSTTEQSTAAQVPPEAAAAPDADADAPDVVPADASASASASTVTAAEAAVPEPVLVAGVPNNAAGAGAGAGDGDGGGGAAGPTAGIANGVAAAAAGVQPEAAAAYAARPASTCSSAADGGSGGDGAPGGQASSQAGPAPPVSAPVSTAAPVPIAAPSNNSSISAAAPTTSRPTSTGAEAMPSLPGGQVVPPPGLPVPPLPPTAAAAAAVAAAAAAAGGAAVPPAASVPPPDAPAGTPCSPPGESAVPIPGLPLPGGVPPPGGIPPPPLGGMMPALPGKLPPPPPPPAAMIVAHQQAAAQKAVASQCNRLGPGGAPVVLAPDGTAPPPTSAHHHQAAATATATTSSSGMPMSAGQAAAEAAAAANHAAAAADVAIHGLGTAPTGTAGKNVPVSVPVPVPVPVPVGGVVVGPGPPPPPPPPSIPPPRPAAGAGGVTVGQLSATGIGANATSNARDPNLGLSVHDDSYNHGASNPKNNPTAQPLYRPSDEDWLSPQLCLVRQQMECFAANQGDINERRTAGGSIHPPAMGQVGLRCVHCTYVPLKERAKGSVLYPKSVRAIHMAMRNFQRHHLMSCQQIPPNVKARYAAIKNKAVQSKKDSYIYLAQSCKDMGVVEKGGYLQMGTEEDLTAFDPAAATPLTSGPSAAAVAASAAAAAAATAAFPVAGMAPMTGFDGHPMMVGPGGDMTKARLMTVQAEPINRRATKPATKANANQHGAARKLNNDNVKAASGLLSLFKKSTPMSAAHAAAVAAAGGGGPFQTAAERATAAAFEQGTLPPEYAQAIAQRQQREAQRAAAVAASAYGAQAAAAHAHAAAMHAGYGGVGIPGQNAAMMYHQAAAAEMPPLPRAPVPGVPPPVSAMEMAAPDQYAAYLNAQKAALTPGDLASRAEIEAASAHAEEQKKLEHFYFLQLQQKKAEEAAAAAAAAVEAARPPGLGAPAPAGVPPGLGPSPPVPPPLPGQIPGAPAPYPGQVPGAPAPYPGQVPGAPAPHAYLGAPAPAYPGAPPAPAPMGFPHAQASAPAAIAASAPPAQPWIPGATAPLPGAFPAPPGVDPTGGELLDPQQLGALGLALDIDPALATGAEPLALSAAEAQQASTDLKAAARRDYLQYLKTLNRMSSTITLAQRQATLLQSFPENASLQADYRATLASMDEEMSSAKIQALRLKEFKLALESGNIQNDSLKQRAAALKQMKPSGGSGQA